LIPPIPKNQQRLLYAYSNQKQTWTVCDTATVCCDSIALKNTIKGHFAIGKIERKLSTTTCGVNKNEE